MKNLLKVLVFVCICLTASFLFAQTTIVINPPATPAPAAPVDESGPPPVDPTPDRYGGCSKRWTTSLCSSWKGRSLFCWWTWYRFWGGAWYSAADYGAPWGAIAAPPAYVGAIPADYALDMPDGYAGRVGYGDFHDHWRSWDHDHHGTTKDFIKTIRIMDGIESRSYW